MLSIGVGRVLYFILLEGYNALAATPLLAMNQACGVPPCARCYRSQSSAVEFGRSTGSI